MNAKLFALCFAMILVINLSGCAQTPQQVVKLEPQLPDTLSLVNTADFGPEPSLMPAENLFVLNDVSKQAFLDYYHDNSRRHIQGHLRVYNYLADLLPHFNYYSDTNTAQQALDTNSGNCLSLAILTTAFANLAQVNISYNEITSAPIYSRDGGIEFQSGHVVSKLLDPAFTPQSGILYLNKPQIIVDYFPTKDSWIGAKVTKDDFISMYYRNLGSDALARNSLHEAGWLATKAIEYAPNDMANINLMAVIYRRLGFPDKSEQLYKHGIEVGNIEDEGKQNLMLLGNYHILLKSQNRMQEALALKQQLDKADDPSPFRWLHLGYEALNDNRLTKAMFYFKKVTEKAHYLPHGYAAMAKVYYLKGRTRAAKEHFEMALQRTRDDDSEKLFEAKLAALSKK